MIDVREAVQAARNEAIELFGDEIEGLRLEEVGHSEDGHDWLVTLSFRFPVQVFAKTPMQEFVTSLRREADSGREYKVFEIDAETGRVESMKIRAV